MGSNFGINNRMAVMRKKKKKKTKSLTVESVTNWSFLDFGYNFVDFVSVIDMSWCVTGWGWHHK